MIRSMSFLSSGICRTTNPQRNSVSTLSYPCIIRFRVLITSFAFGISNDGSFFLMRLMASPIISVLRSTTHLRIMSFSNKSNLFGKSTKQLSKSLIASRTSCRCFKIYSSAINHLFCAVYVGDEVLVAQPLSDYQINFSSKKPFQGIMEIEIVCNIIPLLMVGRIEVHKQITLRIEPNTAKVLTLCFRQRSMIRCMFSSINFIDCCVTSANIAIFLIYKRANPEKRCYGQVTACRRAIDRNICRCRVVGPGFLCYICRKLLYALLPLYIDVGFAAASGYCLWLRKACCYFDFLASLFCRSRHGEVGSSRSISSISARADIGFRQLA